MTQVPIIACIPGQTSVMPASTATVTGRAKRGLAIFRFESVHTAHRTSNLQPSFQSKGGARDAASAIESCAAGSQVRASIDTTTFTVSSQGWTPETTPPSGTHLPEGCDLQCLVIHTFRASRVFP